MTTLRRCVLLATALILMLLFAKKAPAAQADLGATLFSQGRVRATLSGGWGSAFNQNYFVIGGGLGYYILKGWEAGVDYEAWTGSSPQFQKLTPETRYVFTQIGGFYPYVGGFYRRVFYNQLDDTDSVGARAGLYAPVGEKAFVGGGAVAERQLNCDQSIYDHCTVFYPEFSIGFVF